MVYTIGHSPRSLEELLSLLQQFEVEVLADTRSFPRSRRNPQFNPETLAPALAERGIEYQHWPLLGGRRKPQPESPNNAWQHPAFRAYADYMSTPPFHDGTAALEALARQRTISVMCAELAWWRCHRRLIADRLTVDGFEVRHIITPGRDAYPHRLSEGLTLEGSEIVYRGTQPQLPLR